MIDLESIRPIYPYEPWCVTETEFNLDNNYRNETIFSQANGYIGMRGTFEEATPIQKGKGLEGTFINGFYESQKIRYGELAHAYPTDTQTMINTINSKIIKLELDGEVFSMQEGTVENYKRVLDMKKGTVTRSLIWTSPKGKKIALTVERFISLANKHLAVIQYQVKSLNFEGQVKLVSELFGDVENTTQETNSRIDYGPYGRVVDSVEELATDDYIALIEETQHTKIRIGCSAIHSLATAGEVERTYKKEAFLTQLTYTTTLKVNESVKLEKYIVYTTSRDHKKEEIAEIIKEKAIEAVKEGYIKLLEQHTQYLEDFWKHNGIEIKGDVALNQGLRFNLYQLIQSVGRDGHTSIGAKGLSGEGYEGHCFWDTEMYVLPFFLYTKPEIAKALLMYRYHTLPQARERAREMAISKGALYPWRTINGKETSAFFLAGTAQVHINADIAYATSQYIKATNDSAFAKNEGAEILVETARFWAEFGQYIETKDNKFCINGVTGPDEFSVLIDNNAYTNLLAKENLLNAYEVVKMVQQDKEAYEKLVAKVGLEELELEDWKQKAEAMYLAYDEKTMIYPQDDAFMYRKPWDRENTPVDKYPLLDHFHPMIVYRHQVSKQADFILAMFLLSNQFTVEEKKANFDFYDRVTLHESSLSACIFSIVANEIGYKEKAYEYFMTTSRLDIDDYHRNTHAGIHTANMAGTWMSIVNGFLGMRTHDEQLSFAPKLPKKWEGLTVNVQYKGRLINVSIEKDEIVYTLLEGEPIMIHHYDEERWLDK